MFFRNLIGAGMIAGAMLVGTSASAAADPPNCTAADLAGVMSGVSRWNVGPTCSPIPT